MVEDNLKLKEELNKNDEMLNLILGNFIKKNFF